MLLTAGEQTVRKDNPLSGAVGALIIRIGFWGILYYSHNIRNPPKLYR